MTAHTPRAKTATAHGSARTTGIVRHAGGGRRDHRRKVAAAAP